MCPWSAIGACLHEANHFNSYTVYFNACAVEQFISAILFHVIFNISVSFSYIGVSLVCVFNILRGHVGESRVGGGGGNNNNNLPE